MKLKIDSLHYALLAVVVLLAVYAFGSFKEGAVTVTAEGGPGLMSYGFLMSEYEQKQAHS